MERTWTPVELIRWTEAYLAERGFEDPRLNAELLLAGVLRLKRLDLYLQFDRPLTVEELAEYKARLKRRLRHEPLQYIEGTAQFRDLTLEVDRRVLIPRPETELLVGEVLAWAGDESRKLEVLDIGTGSGAIAISLRLEGSFPRVVATDTSAGALELAGMNAARAGATDIDFRHGEFYHPVRGEVFDAIVSNPPYVAEDERSELSSEVREWEPEGALFAGSDGLDAIREIVAGASDHLRPGGLLALEIGASQAAAVAALIHEAGGFGEARVLRDLSERDRFVLAERQEARRELNSPAINDSGSQGIGYPSGTRA